MYRLRIKEVAEQHGYNMAQLSRASGVDFKTIKELFRNPYRNITFYLLIKIAEGMTVDVRELIERETETPS